MRLLVLHGSEPHNVCGTAGTFQGLARSQRSGGNWAVRHSFRDLMLAGDVSGGVAQAHSGLRDRLRDATGEAHCGLDAQLSAFDLTTFDGYRRFLQASAAALLPLESALVEAGVAELFTDWPERARSAAIQIDLVALGAAMHAAIPMRRLTRNGVLGTMYVLEGSRLGARFMLRTVADSADPRLAGATAYLRHGAGKRLWQSFLSRLAGEDLAAWDEEEAIEAATAAFAAFEQAADRA